LPTEYRLAAARLLGYLPESTGLLSTRIKMRTETVPEVEVAMVAALAQRDAESKQEWRSLMLDYGSQTLPVKRALIDNCLRRGDGPALLLELVRAQIIQPAEIDPLKRKQLLENKSSQISLSAEALFASLNPANRQQALEEYQPVLKLKADATKGKLVFEKNCSNCHKVGDVGVNVAPDISDTRTKTAGQLLADIIQPNRAIDNNYIGYQVLLKDGTVTTGILTAETSTSLTLKQPGGKVLTVARDEVEQLKASGVSLMPDGLEKNIPLEAMADLLAYLKGWRYLDGKTPLGPMP
jgi:putative heme-binding domain-containing protein